MIRVTKFALAVLLIACSAGAYAADKPSVLVTTGKIEHREINETLTGFGTVVPDIGGTININLPRPGQVSRLLVSTGQIAKRGAPLAEFDTGATSALGYRHAETALTFAQQELARVEAMVAQKLATQSQLAAARRRVVDAEAALQTQRSLGAGLATQTVTAPFDGIVIGIPVAQGDRIVAGATVLRFARLNGLRLELGIEPTDSDRVRPGMPVHVSSVLDGRRSFDTRVDQVHGMVNPQTQLVDVVVKLGGKTLIPGMRVRGRIVVERKKVWGVPRSAVLRDAQGAYLFQVKSGHARRIPVKVVAESGAITGVSGDFDPALGVVVVGNYELKDGMAVRESAR